MLTDVRSGIAILKADIATPALPIGKSESVEVATPVITIGYPLDLPETPSFGMIAGFDRKFLGRYFSTTHLRVNVPTQRGEAGAPILNFKGEVVGILVSSIENGSACYALPIDAAEKIRNDFVRFGEARHGWIGINVKKRLATIEESLASASAIKKLELIQERRDLTVELATMGTTVDLSQFEKGFIKNAKTYSERKGITYATWREVGVAADVLKKAGITRGI